MLIFSFMVKRLWNLLFILLPWTDLQEALMPWISYTIGQAAGGWIIVFTDKTIHKATIWTIYVPHFFTFSFQLSLVLHGYWCQQGDPACNCQTIAFEPNIFGWIICHQFHCSNTQISQHLQYIGLNISAAYNEESMPWKTRKLKREECL